MAELTFVAVGCHCTQKRFRVAFVTSQIPQANFFCNCSTCRHSTGGLGVQATFTHGPPKAIDSEDLADLSTLTKYTIRRVNRYFCGTCGANLVYSIEADPIRWGVAAGAMERVEGITKIAYHIYVGDTMDGGFANHYRALDGVELPRYKEHDPANTLPIDWRDESLNTPKPPISGEEVLRFYCHCGNLDLYLKRLKELPDSPEEWWFKGVKEKDGKLHYMAGYCVCNDCRSSSGFLFTGWFFVPRQYLFDKRSDLPIVLAPEHGGERPKGLVQYQSSPGVMREFCGTCGAKAFGWAANQKGLGGEKMSLGIGLVDEASGGARAEHWCSWWKEIFFPQDALDKEGYQAVLAALNSA